MRTNVIIDEQLISEAMRLSHAQTKKEVVNLALQNFVAQLRRKSAKNLFGKVTWEGDLNKMREL